MVDSITLTYYGTTAPADVTKLTKDIRLADFTAELKDGVLRATITTTFQRMSGI